MTSFEIFTDLEVMIYVENELTVLKIFDFIVE